MKPTDAPTPNAPLSTDADTQQRISLQPADSHRLAELCGQFNENLQQIEERLQVRIANRGHDFNISGPSKAVASAAKVLSELYAQTGKELVLPELVHLHLQESHREEIDKPSDSNNSSDGVVPAFTTIKTKRLLVRPRGPNQQSYVKTIQNKDINFGIGPAGTGKTWLAVACAVAALEQDQVRRILLVRPAVEAGEKLGFLPGDLSQKIDPYLRPLYDALYEMIGFEVVGKLIERHVIEVAPLAYMRGRTLNDSFIILDESQNTTMAQMKMFLTRIGFGSTAVITGDLTQIDLPRGTPSGLAHVVKVLKGVPDIGFTHFDAKDVVRHTLVQRIVEAYDRFEAADSKKTPSSRAP